MSADLARFSAVLPHADPCHGRRVELPAPRETTAIDAARVQLERQELEAIELERSGRNLETERQEARQKRRDREIEANLDSDLFWDHGGPPRRAHSSYFVIGTDDPEILGQRFADCGIACDLFRDSAGKPVSRHNGWLVECYGVPEFSTRLIEMNALGDVLKEFPNLEAV